MIPRGKPSNPFSVHRLGPEATEYLFPESQPLQWYTAQLDAAHWRAELCAPKGFGKSTLLVTLLSEARRRHMRVVQWQCSDRVRRLPWNWRWAVRGADVVAVDGAERLASRQLRALRALCERAEKGLLITVHEPAGMKLRFELRPQAETLAVQVNALLEGTEWRACEEKLAALLAECDGSARLALFALYDAWEQDRMGDYCAGGYAVPSTIGSASSKSPML